MAWAEQLPSGKWRGVYRDANGKRRSAGTFDHKPKAVRAASTREAEARRRMAADPEAYKRPWGEWADDWWEARNVAASTLKVDAYRRARYLDPEWASVPIGSIRKHDIEDWAARLRRQGSGPASVRRTVALFSLSLVAAVDKGIIDANPAAGVVKKLPAEPPEPDRYLTRGEYAAIRAHLPTTDDQLTADLLVYTGMRWGELAGLHWHRVDLERGSLVVAETYDDSTSTMKPFPKGKRTRDLPLVPFLVDLLERRQETARVSGGCGLPHGSGRCRSALVLTTDRGAPLRNSNWSPVWRDAVERAGVGHVRIHDLRHTAASWLLQEGIPLAEVGRFLGHKSLQTTERYARLAAPPSAAILAALAPRLPLETGAR